MATFAVHYTYIADAERRLEIRPAHRDFLNNLAEQGICLVAGAYAEGEVPGGLLIFRSASKHALDEILKQDPFQLEGIVTACEIKQWGPAVGPYAEPLA